MHNGVNDAGYNECKSGDVWDWQDLLCLLYIKHISALGYNADYSYAPWRTFWLWLENNEARKVPPNAVLANNSIILRLNHSKLTHFRRRQRHINYDSDVPKGPAGEGDRNRNLSRANNKLALLCLSLCRFGVSFFRVLAKKANSKRLFARHLVLIFGRGGERVGRGGG